MTGFTGTGSLLRLAARRDRVLIPASILAIALVVAMAAKATIDLYPDSASALGAMRSVVDNPAIVALYGPFTSLTLDAFATFKTILMGAVFLCLLAYIVVRRHTRTEEESGRLELLGAGAIGRRAPLAAAVLLATIAVLLTALATAAVAIGVGLDRTGSVALGVAWTVVGLTWVGVTAVAAQLAETARGTAGLSIGALGVAFLLRALGDTAPDGSPVRFLTWLSPLGWGEKVAPYGENRVGLITLGLVAYAGLVLLAFILLERRDLGAGLLPSRPGAARGSLRSAGALTARLARGTVIGWLIAYGILAVVIGSIAGNVVDFVDSPETAAMLRRLGGSAGTIVDTFFATEIQVAAIAAAALGIALVTRIRTEETAGRAEAVLSTPVRRTPWALGHVTVAVVATTLVMVVLGIVAGAVDGQRTGDVGASIASLVGAGASTLPAVWVCIGAALVLVGYAPRFTGLAWPVLIAFFVVGELAELMSLPHWVASISPFHHLPRLPGGSADAVTLTLLTLAAAALLVIGLAGLRRRDLPAG